MTPWRKTSGWMLSQVRRSSASTGNTSATSLVGVERPEEGLCRVSYGSGAHAGGGQTEQTVPDRSVGADARQRLGERRRPLVDQGLQRRRELRLPAGGEVRHVVEPELGPVEPSALPRSSDLAVWTVACDRGSAHGLMAVRQQTEIGPPRDQRTTEGSSELPCGAPPGRYRRPPSSSGDRGTADAEPASLLHGADLRFFGAFGGSDAACVRALSIHGAAFLAVQPPGRVA